jgi:hypothetical protein
MTNRVSLIQISPIDGDRHFGSLAIIQPGQVGVASLALLFNHLL